VRSCRGIGSIPLLETAQHDMGWGTVRARRQGAHPHPDLEDLGASSTDGLGGLHVPYYPTSASVTTFRETLLTFLGGDHRRTDMIEGGAAIMDWSVLKLGLWFTTIMYGRGVW